MQKAFLIVVVIIIIYREKSWREVDKDKAQEQKRCWGEHGRSYLYYSGILRVSLDVVRFDKVWSSV